MKLKELVMNVVDVVVKVEQTFAVLIVEAQDT